MYSSIERGFCDSFFKKTFLTLIVKLCPHESGYFWNRIFFIWILGDVDLEPLFTTCTSPKMHLICPPKFCISIVFNFPWDGCNTQGEMENKGYAKFWRETSCVMGDVQWRMERGFKTILFRWADSLVSWGQRPDLCKKVCGFENSRIRVDVA